MEQVLGIEPTAAGFSSVSIRPDLAGLEWARGAEPTPRGLIRIDIRRDKIQVNLPPGTIATLSLPFAPGAGQILQNGKPISIASTEGNSRSQVMLKRAGDYTFTASAKGGRP